MTQRWFTYSSSEILAVLFRLHEPFIKEQQKASKNAWHWLMIREPVEKKWKCWLLTSNNTIFCLTIKIRCPKNHWLWNRNKTQWFPQVSIGCHFLLIQVTTRCWTLSRTAMFFWVGWWVERDTVDGRNPPVDMVNIPLFTVFHTCWVVQDFVHQQ